MWKDKAVHLLLAGAASTSILIVFLIFVFLGKEAAPFIRDPGLSSLLDTNSRLDGPVISNRFRCQPPPSMSRVSIFASTGVAW